MSRAYHLNKTYENTKMLTQQLRDELSYMRSTLERGLFECQSNIANMQQVLQQTTSAAPCPCTIRSPLTKPLPSEIVRHILAQLPPKDVLRMRLVNRAWNTLVLDNAEYWRGHGEDVVVRRLQQTTGSVADFPFMTAESLDDYYANGTLFDADITRHFDGSSLYIPTVFEQLRFVPPTTGSRLHYRLTVTANVHDKPFYLFISSSKTTPAISYTLKWMRGGDNNHYNAHPVEPREGWRRWIVSWTAPADTSFGLMQLHCNSGGELTKGYVAEIRLEIGRVSRMAFKGTLAATTGTHRDLE